MQFCTECCKSSMERCLAQRLWGRASSRKISIVLLPPRTHRGETPSLGWKKPSQENPVNSSAHCPQGINYTLYPGKWSFPFSLTEKAQADRGTGIPEHQGCSQNPKASNLEKAGSMCPHAWLKSIKEESAFPVSINQGKNFSDFQMSETPGRVNPNLYQNSLTP